MIPIPNNVKNMMTGIMIKTTFLIIFECSIFHCFAVNPLTFGTSRIERTTAEEAKMKYMLMRSKNADLYSIVHWAFASEYPIVQIGGISAVAIATPGITFENFSSLV